MKHTSVVKPGAPIEFITTEAISPFISKCLIKVCYVGDEPNRNRSIITKNVARKMAPSLRGCPIVGFFNETKGDFEQHNQMIQQINGEWRLTSMTKPYGFVDVNAKVWFQSYIDDGEVEREYLCTEGYIWDHAFPEAKRVTENGNNQSMELDEPTLDAFWSKDENGRPEFFIINEALLSKLCILGDDNEPCFEGSQITAFNLSFEEEFKQQLFAMMNELKETLQEGGTKVFTTYAVEIGDALWSALYRYIEETYPDGENRWCSKYSLDGVFEEGGQKFAILCNRADMKYYRLNFSISESDGFSAEAELVEVTKTYTPAETPQFATEAVEAYASNYAAKKEEEEKKKQENEDKKGQEDSPENKGSSEEGNSDDDNEDKKKKKEYTAEELCPKCGKPLAECVCEVEEPKQYSLEEIPEYVDLQARFTELSSKFEQLTTSFEELSKAADAATNELKTLREFKLQSERKDKEEMIARFYMLSDEDKKDVLDNIDTYSLDDIEAKLSVICVRNKVSFAQDDSEQKDPVVFNLNNDNNADDITPAWVKAALNVAKSLNN